MYEFQHRINTTKNMARYKLVVRPLCCLQWNYLVVWKGIIRSQDHCTPPFEASCRLFMEWRWWQNYIARCILTYGTYQKGRVSLRAQGTKRQVIFHFPYAHPKINHVMFWNKVTVTGSLASLSIICLASNILCQLGCHLLLLCGSVVNLLLWWHVKEDDGSFNYLSCSVISDNKYKNRRQFIQQ
jgi:hypothetical protein